MSSVRDMIKNSMKLIQAIGQNETPSAEEASDGMSSLNRMISSWSTNGLVVYSRVREAFTLTPGTQVYTMGTGGTINTPRPVRIEQAAIEYQGSDPYERAIDIYNQDEWASVNLKSLSSSIPSAIYLEGTFPLETINVWPVPASAEKLVLYSWKPLTEYTSLNTTLSLPPGYEDAITNNLALRLCPEYGKPATPELIAMAIESKENIERLNIKPFYMKCDEATLSRCHFTDIRKGPWS